MRLIGAVKIVLFRIENRLKKKQAKGALLFLLIALLFLNASRTDVFRRFLTTREFYGDENKYMRIVQSLAADGDLDLANLWFKKEDMKEVWKKILSSPGRTFGDLYFLGIDGGIYALHMPGVAFLILPAYKLDSKIYPNDPRRSPVSLRFLPKKLLATLLWLAILTILNLTLFFRLLDGLFDSAFLIMLVFLLLIYNSPFPYYSFTVFPGCSATVFLLLALNCLFFPFRSRKLSDSFLILAIAFLPWLHQRFIPLSAGLFVIFLINSRKSGAPWRRLLFVGLLVVVLSLPYFYYFYSLTGNPSPLSTAGFFGSSHFSARVIPVGFFGLLFSPSQGSIWKYPWIVLVFFGIYWGLKKEKKLAGSLLLPAFLYYLGCSTSMILGGGANPPGRFLLPLFPILLIFVGFVFQDLQKNSSFSKCVFYPIFVSLFFLSKRMLLLHFSDDQLQPPFGRISITEPYDPGWIIKSLAIIAVIFLSVFLSDRFLFAQKDHREEK